MTLFTLYPAARSVEDSTANADSKIRLLQIAFAQQKDAPIVRFPALSELKLAPFNR
jgi:hypothetical protein